jgi:transcriptional regulator with XRE-family HTH domain
LTSHAERRQDLESVPKVNLRYTFAYVIIICMSTYAVPAELTGLLPADLSRQVDAFWTKATSGSRDEAESYVRSVEVMYDAVADGIQQKAPQTELSDETRQEVITAMALAPVVAGPDTGEASTAVLAVGALRLGVIMGAGAIVAAAVVAMTEVLKQRQERSATGAPIDVPSTAVSITDIVAQKYESPVSTIRRVFDARSNAQLAELLGTSAPTISAWEHGATPNRQNARKLEYTAALAKLTHEFIDPSDLKRYLYHTSIPGLGGRTIDAAIRDGDAEAAYDVLASALSR